MRIAFVTLGFAPDRMSGLDISGERLVHGLLNAGHYVTVIAGARNRLIETKFHPSLTIVRVPIGRSNWIGFAIRAAQILKRLGAEPFDVVHFCDVHFAFTYRGKYVASVQQSFRQRWETFDRANATLVTQFSRYSYYSLARHLTEIPSLKRAHGLLAGSSTTREEFIKAYGISSGSIVLARHGIDTNFFCRRPSEHLRERFRLAPDEPVILFAGFVTPRKGLDYLARALPLIYPSPKLIIAGQWSKISRSRFYALLGPATSQIIEAGFVADEDMPALYSLADVYVSSSLLEGFGLPLAESLACETPVVAVNVGAVNEVVGPGGILVRPADSNALAQTVTNLLGDPWHRREMGRRGREHIVREFNVQAMIAATLKAYDQFG